MTTPGSTEHNLIKYEKYADLSIALLQRELALAGLFWQWSAMDFKGAKNDTVNVKVPGTLPARDRDLRATGEDRKIQMDYLTEQTVGVKLTKFPYSATEITDEQLNLDIADFGAQILQPQVDGMARYIEDFCVEQLSSAEFADGRLSKDRLTIEDADSIKGTLKAEDFYGKGKHGMASLFNRVRTNLIKRGVGLNNITVAVGADFEEVLLEEDILLDASKGGDNTALRDAVIGKLRGFTFISVPYLEPTEAYVFTNTSFILATAAPAVPLGATYGASKSAGNTALRWLRDYDADYAVDRSVVDCFAGTGIVNDVSMEDGEEHFLRGMKITMDRAKVEKAKAETATTPGVSAGE